MAPSRDAITHASFVQPKASTSCLRSSATERAYDGHLRPHIVSSVRPPRCHISAILSPGTAGTPPPLGQVNGALGDTIGKLLNGKKTAIGLLGAVITPILSAVPPGSGLGQVLGMLTPAAGLSPFTMPIFLGLAAWGVLGKMEKWAQGTAPPPKA